MAGDKKRWVELRPDIYQIVGVKPACHTYLIRGSTKNVLLDPGLPSTQENLRECLGELGLSVPDIRLVILTHEHMDHAGATPWFHGTAVVAAHSLAANKIALGDEFVMLNDAFDVSSGAFRVDLCFEGECVLDLGNYRFQILHTPGHCSGSICLYEPDHRLLFTGDTVMAGGVMGGIFGSGNISDYINTLRRLTAFKVDEFYPGHGKASTTPQEDLAKAVERSVALLRDSRALFEALNAKGSFDHIFRSARNLNA